MTAQLTLVAMYIGCGSAVIAAWTTRRPWTADVAFISVVLLAVFAVLVTVGVRLT